MNITDLIRGEKFDTAPCAFETLRQVFTGFFFGVGLQFDDMEALWQAAKKAGL